MYGYIIAAAACNVTQTADKLQMVYPGEVPSHEPAIMHYGGKLIIGPAFTWDKHDYSNTDLLDCNDEEMVSPVFPPHPPMELVNLAPGASVRRSLSLQVETAEALAGALGAYRERECDEEADAPVRLSASQVSHGVKLPNRI